MAVSKTGGSVGAHCQKCEREGATTTGDRTPAHEAHQPIETDHEPQVERPDIWAGGDTRIPRILSRVLISV